MLQAWTRNSSEEQPASSVTRGRIVRTTKRGTRRSRRNAPAAAGSEDSIAHGVKPAGLRPTARCPLIPEALMTFANKVLRSLMR